MQSGPNLEASPPETSIQSTTVTVLGAADTNMAKRSVQGEFVHEKSFAVNTVFPLEERS